VNNTDRSPGFWDQIRSPACNRAAAGSPLWGQVTTSGPLPGLGTGHPDSGDTGARSPPLGWTGHDLPVRNRLRRTGLDRMSILLQPAAARTTLSPCSHLMPGKERRARIRRPTVGISLASASQGQASRLRGIPKRRRTGALQDVIRGACPNELPFFFRVKGPSRLEWERIWLSALPSRPTFTLKRIAN
jgi:hypothetical protein